MAFNVADAEGLEALSMPALARRLQCGVMTIYGYVESKEDLLDAIAQRGMRDLRLSRPLPETPEGILLAWGRALRMNLIEHPSLPMIFLARAVVGPGILRGVEMLLGALSGAGMPPPSAVQAIYAVLIYTTGFVAWEIPRTVRQPASAYASAWRREFAGQPPDALPLVAKAIEELALVASEEQFELGLVALVRGLRWQRH